MKNIDNKMNMLLSRSMSQPSTGQGGRQRDLYLESAVHNTILKRAVDIQKAYNVYLARHPKISDGNIKLDWQIGQDGRTISPEVVTSDFHDKKFEADIIQSIANWKFPPPPFGMNKYVVHSFKLSKVKE